MAEPAPPTIHTLPFEPAKAPATPYAHHYGDVGAYIVRRFLALLFDLFVAGGLIAVAFDVWIAAIFRKPASSLEVWEALGLLGIAIFVYRWLFEGLAGSTPGKLLFGLATGRKGGGHAGMTRAFVRNLVLPIDLAGIGFLLAALTPLRQRCGDFLAGTVVAGTRVGLFAPVIGLLIFGGAAASIYWYGGGTSLGSRLANDAASYRSYFERQSPAPQNVTSPSPAPRVTTSPALPATPKPVT